ncbi:GumC family protein [Fervidobacterium thailandense]|uniref:Lipopolysaccharide biosynthesis protein n=1 Tax=Fervidobacterium thailandense TaxID=1008305 RepID=A0A1E3G0R6_9BACT|nr:GumC family protein [Fervidobacterium thailandense]ODN29817.1 hypothetical protein A4H02_08670 [Fervidobacterium thailandense]
MTTSNYVRVKDDITVTDILKILKKRIKVVFLVFTITLLFTILYVEFVATPLYEATAKLKIPATSSGFGTLGSVAALILGTEGTGSPDVTTQQEIMLSRTVLEEVVRKTGLLEVKQRRENNKNLTMDQVVDYLKRKKTISISSVKNSSIIEIKVYDSDRELAKKILEELINSYIATYVRLNKDEKTAQLEVLERQIPELEREIAEIGEKIKNFKLTKSVSPSQEGELYVSAIATLAKEKYETENEIQSTKAAVARIEAQINALQADKKKLGYTPTSGLLEKYRAELAELQTRYSSLIQQYTEDHPDVKSTRAQIEQVEREIEKEIQRIVSSKIESPSPLLQELYSQLIENKLKLPILETKLSALNKSIQDVESKLKKLPLIEQEYLNLERDYKIKQTIYAALVQKYEELKLNAAGSEANKPQIVDPPYVPERPSKPDKKLSLAIGAVAGLFMAFLSAFLREGLDKKLRTIEDLLSIISVPLILLAKSDREKALSTMFTHILNNFPKDHNFALISPDSERALELAYNLSQKVLNDSKLSFSVLSIDDTELVCLDKKIGNEHNDNGILILKAPVLEKSYQGYIVAKKSDGVILVVELHHSLKTNVLNFLSWCSENEIKVYGVIIFEQT